MKGGGGGGSPSTSPSPSPSIPRQEAIPKGSSADRAMFMYAKLVSFLGPCLEIESKSESKPSQTQYKTETKSKSPIPNRN